MFSIIVPMDPNRLEQFTNTKRKYDQFTQPKEFLIITRHPKEIADFLKRNSLDKDVQVIGYKWEKGFNPSMAFNIGVRNAKYDQVIITSPEVIPKTDVLDQLEELIGANVVCRVWDENEEGKLVASLVHDGYRSESPAMYFLALFNKKDIEAINGWDEDFMRGYAYEDNDFGDRWVRARLPFMIREDIEAIHQYHPRGETIRGGMSMNFEKYCQNKDNNVTYCANGLKK